jgi:predicted metal-dependent hydrolase
MSTSRIPSGLPVGHFGFENVSFEYHLVRQARKTLSVTVFPSQDLLVKAPHGVPVERVEEFLQRKIRWILKQKRYFAQFRDLVEKRCVSGESFRYRGRSYKLLVREDAPERVSLTHGTLRVFSCRQDAPEHTRRLLEDWYSRKARIVFTERLRECFMLFDYPRMPGLAIRRMTRRWGSYSQRTGIVNLNVDLIRASTRYIDYVIIHELCHVSRRNHDREFYELLESKLPGWKELKTELELSLLS